MRPTALNGLLASFLALPLIGATAQAAPTVVTGQPTVGAQKMNAALRKIKVQQLPHLQETLERRNLPKSVIAAPSKLYERGIRELQPRLELGLTGEPTVVQGQTTGIDVRGNANSKVLNRVYISSTTGNIQGAAAMQHIQVTHDIPVAGQKRDPRHGIQMSSDGVAMWRIDGQTTNNNAVRGGGRHRFIKPLSPGMMFRGEALGAGSHLVTSQSGAQMQMTFTPTGALASATGGNSILKYLLRADAKAKGGFRVVKLNDQEFNDLNASTGGRSYTMKNGAVQDNAAPGHDQQALREGGFID